MDVLLHAVHAVLVLGPRHGRADGEAGGGRRRRGGVLGQRPPQAFLDVRDAPDGQLVGAVHVAPLDEDVGHDRDAVAQMVEDQHRVREQERHLGQAHVVRRRLRQCLEAPHQIVAEVADEAAGQGRQAAHRRRPVAAHQLRGRREGVVMLQLEPPAVLPHEKPAAGVGREGAGADAEERVTAQVPALFRTLQEKGATRLPELEECRNGGLQVGDEGVGDGQDVVRQCEAASLD